MNQNLRQFLRHIEVFSMKMIDTNELFFDGKGFQTTLPFSLIL